MRVAPSIGATLFLFGGKGEWGRKVVSLTLSFACFMLFLFCHPSSDMKNCMHIHALERYLQMHVSTINLKKYTEKYGIPHD